MGIATITTPVMIEAEDYHEFNYLFDFLRQFKPDPCLDFYKDSEGETHWAADGQYYAIIYIRGQDDIEAQKIWKTLVETSRI